MSKIDTTLPTVKELKTSTAVFGGMGIGNTVGAGMMGVLSGNTTLVVLSVAFAAITNHVFNKREKQIEHVANEKKRMDHLRALSRRNDM